MTKDLGSLLKNSRIKKNLTQDQVAKKLGLGKQSIFNIESNRAPLPNKYIKKYSQIISIDPYEIVGLKLKQYTIKMFSEAKLK